MAIVTNMNIEKNSSESSHVTTTLGIIVCALGAIFYAYEYFLRISPSVMTTELMEYFHMNAAAFGGVTAFYYYAYVPMQLPVGMLMDRFGPRRLLTFACAMCVLGTYIFVCSKSLVLAALGRFIVGFGSSFAFVGVLKLATIWLAPSRFAMFAGLSAALGTIGAMFGDIAMTRMVDSLGWIKTMDIAAIAGIVLTLILFFVIRDKATPNAEESAPVSNGSFSKSLREVGQLLTNPQMWLVGLVGCFIYLPTTVFAELWGIPYLEHAQNFTAEQAAFGVSWIFLGFTFGAPFFWLVI